jgi:hypothetical protein
MLIHIFTWEAYQQTAINPVVPYKLIKVQDENPCQVLLVLLGLMSAPHCTHVRAALVSIKESVTYLCHDVGLVHGYTKKAYCEGRGQLIGLIDSTLTVGNPENKFSNPISLPI